MSLQVTSAGLFEYLWQLYQEAIILGVIGTILLAYIWLFRQ
jgi:hypothetical protein